METTHAPAPDVQPPPTVEQTGGPLLQRKCACGGGSAGLSGHCGKCQEKRFSVQRYSRDRSLLQLISQLAQPVSLSPWTSEPVRGDGASYNFNLSLTLNTDTRPRKKRAPAETRSSGIDQGDERVATETNREDSRPLNEMAAPAPDSWHSATGSRGTSETAQLTANEGSSPATANAERSGDSGLIVEDDVEVVGPNQMRKGEFIEALRIAIRAAADAELAAVGRSTEGCPYLAQWLDYYRTRSSQQGERALRRYVPEAGSLTSARDYIPMVAERVRRSVSVWASTGQVVGIPDELAPLVAGPRDAGNKSGANIFAKARDGGVRGADDPQQIQSQLGAGAALDSSVKSRMESAFGHDFSRVRIHSDSQAAALSSHLNARAFTVGNDIAFGGQEYKPGTLVGDALLAHELAHVMQQEDAGISDSPLQKGDAAYGALEEDADNSAVGAILSMWGGVKGSVGKLSQRAMPGLKSGLRLQRCDNTPRLRKRTVSGPTTGDCDDYSWGSQWYLENAGSNNGWIVQKVQDIFEVTDCGGVALSNADIMTRTGGLDPSLFPYWEAWQVRSGIVYVGGGTSPHQADTYGLQGISGDSRGRERIIGDAEFYHNLVLPSSFSVRANHPAGSLPVATSAPTLTGGTGTLAHNLTANWNCCPGSPSRATTVALT